VRAGRLLFLVPGAALASYGGWLLLRQASWRPVYLISLGGWLFGGVALHDAVVAPVVAVAGLVVARLLPPPWRGAVAGAAASTAALLLVAVPLLWRPDSAPRNPGLHDRPHATGLALWVGLLWTILLLNAVFIRARRPGSGGRSGSRIRRSPARPPQPAPTTDPSPRRTPPAP
jgi:hypothetical protein